VLDSATLLEIAGGKRRPALLVSIVIPHYRTEELVRLCLRAIRRFTEHPYEVIVVDNNSADESLSYLRQVRWIRLVERGEEVEPNGVNAHAAAMDIGTSYARGDYLLSFHTDTIVKREGWLADLVSRLREAPRAAALGCGKLQNPSRAYRAIKKMWDTHRMRRWLRRLFGLKENPRFRKRDFYPRSYCALYDLSVLRRPGLSFRPTPNCAAGENLYRDILARGYVGIELEPKEMAQYVEHISHATALLGGQRHRHWRTRSKIGRAVKRVMGSEPARQLLTDDTLDR